MNKPQHKPIALEVRTPVGPDAEELFFSELNGTADVIVGGVTTPGLPIQANGMVRTRVLGKVGNVTGTFQWRKNGVVILGATSPTLTISPVSNSDAGDYEDSRQGDSATDPALAVTIAGTTIVAAHAVPPVGGSNPYRRVISDTFTATTSDLELAFIKSNPQGGDNTALVDSVCVVRLAPGTPPIILRDPMP